MDTKRRWLDWDIVAKVTAGLVMMAIPAFAAFGEGFITMRLWVLGILGLVIFCWGLFSIGDIKEGGGWE